MRRGEERREGERRGEEKQHLRLKRGSTKSIYLMLWTVA